VTVSPHLVGPDFSRAAAQTSLKQGMMAKFKSSFVAPQAAGGDANSFSAQAAPPRPALHGFANAAEPSGPSGGSLPGFARASTSIMPDAPLERHNTDAEIAEALAHARAVAHAQAYGAPYAALGAFGGPGAEVAAAAAQARALAYAQGMGQMTAAGSAPAASNGAQGLVGNGHERGADDRQRSHSRERKSRWDRQEENESGGKGRYRDDSGADRSRDRPRERGRESFRSDREESRDRDGQHDGRASERDQDHDRDEGYRREDRKSQREREREGDRKRERTWEEGRRGTERRRRWDT
jgi:hypothetical protein